MTSKSLMEQYADIALRLAAKGEEPCEILNARILSLLHDATAELQRKDELVATAYDALIVAEGFTNAASYREKKYYPQHVQVRNALAALQMANAPQKQALTGGSDV